MKHVAVIPGRKGSKGFPGKNRLFFELTAEFIKISRLFDRVIVASDDEKLLEIGREEGFETYLRSDEVSRDDSAIRDVFVELIENNSFDEDDYLWLFYIPILSKDPKHFERAKKIIDDRSPPSLSSFIPAKSHPFNCWRVAREKGTIEKYIDNDTYNRQDFPDAWENHHYVFCIRVDEVPNVDGNLLNQKTYPMFLTEEEGARLLEADSPSDLLIWKEADPAGYMSWKNKVTVDFPLP